MASLSSIVDFCNKRVHLPTVKDFPGAYNGLQFENNGAIQKIGAAVDAGLEPFKKAVQAGVDLLIVHHGLFWNAHAPITDISYRRYKYLIEHNLAIYSCHLPLDCHQEIGNNALIAQKLGLQITDWVIPYEGTPMIPVCSFNKDRSALTKGLKPLFPRTFKAIEFGSQTPSKIAICSGSSSSVVEQLKTYDIDTLIAGELKQQFYNFAQEHALNLYPCGHYATEIFGVNALAQEAASFFNLPYTFIQTDCML